MSKRWDQLQATLGKVCDLLDQLERRADKMETILMIREPSSSVAAEAYDGLRRQVVVAVTERLTHLAQLAQLDVTLAGGAEPDILARLVTDWIEQASLTRVTNPDHPDWRLFFEMVEDLGGHREVLEPAYVDGSSGRVIRQGRVRCAPPVGPAVPDPVNGDLPAAEDVMDEPVAAGEAS